MENVSHDKQMTKCLKHNPRRKWVWQAMWDCEWHRTGLGWELRKLGFSYRKFLCNQKEELLLTHKSGSVFAKWILQDLASSFTRSYYVFWQGSVSEGVEEKCVSLLLRHDLATSTTSVVGEWHKRRQRYQSWRSEWVKRPLQWGHSHNLAGEINDVSAIKAGPEGRWSSENWKAGRLCNLWF